MAYLYRHIRLDTKTPFYIGIGSDENYTRAYDKRSRNKHWTNIVKKANYEVEIVLDDLSWEEACEKEKEFINLYGRKDLNEGCLCNMTNGGEGVLGVVKKESSKKKAAEKISKVILQYDIEGNFLKKWNSITEACNTLKLDTSAIAKCCKGSENRKSVGGYVWRYENSDKWFDPKYICNTGVSEKNKQQRLRKKKKVVQYSAQENFIKEWDSPTDAAIEYNTTAENIYRSIKSNSKAVGYIWKYKEY